MVMPNGLSIVTGLLLSGFTSGYLIGYSVFKDKFEELSSVFDKGVSMKDCIEMTVRLIGQE
jgi:hypothetical protein